MTAPGWKQATRRDPCVACGHVGWCAYSLDGNMIMCRRVDTGEGIPRTDSNGSDYWLYPRDTNITFDPSRMPPPAPTAERASPDMLHDVYGAFLAELPLNQLHRQELAARGLSPEAIKRLGFKSMPGEGRAAIARKLEEQFGRSTLLKTPGFYVKDEGGSNWISIAGSAGLLIPIPDHEGRLVALQTRLDNPGDYGKYLSFSSTGHDGPGPGSQVVWPLGAYNVPGDPLRLAEGILKGIVANELSGVTTLGLPGNYIPDFLILLLQDMEPSEVILALDADARKNLHVAKSLQTCVYKLDEAGLPMALEVWDPSHGKGIDDMLAGGHTPDLLRSHKAHQRVHEIVQAATQAQADKFVWGIPVPFTEQHGPEWPENVLPAVTGRFLSAQATELQVPLGLVGPTILASVASATQGKAEVYVRPGWKETLNTYVVPVLPPAERKSSTVNAITLPITEYEKKIREAAMPTHSQLTVEREIDEKRLSALKEKAAKEDSKGSEIAGYTADGMRQDAVELQQKMDTDPIKALPRLTTVDITPEKLAILMKEQGERISLITTEAGIFGTIGGRYSNGVANLDLFMQAYTGDPTTVDRVSRESIRLEQPLLTMLISPQPDLLRELGEHPIFRQRGLLARIDFTMPESLVGGRDPDAPPVPPELRQAWCAALTRLLKIPMPPVGEAHTLSLSREAQAVFRPFQQTSENNLNPGEYYEDIVDWGGRVPGKAIRIAGQLHMLECAEAQTGDSWVWTDEISGPTMARAIEIASYYAEHALVVLDFMKNKGTGGDLEKVWQSIQRRGFSGFTLSDLHQSVRRQFEPPELLKVLRSLVDMNYLREVHRERTGKAGRPCSPLFETNPGKRTFNPNNTSQAAIPGNKLDSLYETEEVGFENEPTIEAAESPVTTPHVMPSGPDADCRICAVVTSGICSRHAAEAGMSFEDLP